MTTSVVDPARSRHDRSSTATTGLVTVLRLTVRRDRILLLGWVVMLALLPTALVSATRTAYPDSESRRLLAAGTLSNAAELALRGPVFSPTVGGIVTWTCASSGVLVMAVVSALLVIRYTRSEEQAGRLELLSSLPVGRRVPLLAGLLVVLTGDVAVALLAALGLTVSGLPLAGSVALGLVLGGGGAVFAALAALAAQVASTSAAAKGICLTAVGVSFALAATGDLRSDWLGWLSPLGWARRTEAFAGNRWWVLALFAAAALALLAAAGVSSARRDLGSGLVPARPGRGTAGPGLAGPFSLLWRRQRGVVLACVAGMAVLGALFGASARSLDAQLDTPEFHRLAVSVGAGSPAQAFFQIVLYVFAQVAAAFTLSTVLRSRNDEVAGLADLVLAAPVSRSRWLLGYLGMAVVTAAGVLAATGLASALAFGLGRSGAEHQSLHPFAITLSYLPACLLVTALSVVLIGWVPRWAVAASWTLLALLVMVDLLGEFRVITGDALRASPFQYTLHAMAGGSAAEPLVGLTALAAVLVVVGLAGIRRRDLG